VGSISKAEQSKPWLIHFSLYGFQLINENDANRSEGESSCSTSFDEKGLLKTLRDQNNAIPLKTALTFILF
jgi:hypothetical protein